MTVNSQLLSSYLTGHDEQHQFKSTSSNTTNGHDETSESDSTSFNDEYRQEFDDIHDEQVENYDQLLSDIIDILTKKSKKEKKKRD